MNSSIKFATHPATSDLVLLAIFGAIGSVFLGVIGTSFWIIAIYIVWATGLAWIWLFLTSMIAVGLVALGLLAHDPKVRKTARWLAPPRAWRLRSRHPSHCPQTRQPLASRLQPHTHPSKRSFYSRRIRSPETCELLLLATLSSRAS